MDDLSLSALEFAVTCDAKSCSGVEPEAKWVEVTSLPCGCVGSRMLCSLCAANRREQIIRGYEIPVPSHHGMDAYLAPVGSIIRLERIRQAVPR